MEKMQEEYKEKLRTIELKNTLEKNTLEKNTLEKNKKEEGEIEFVDNYEEEETN